MTFTNAATITLANNAAALNIDSGLMVFNSLNNRIGINTGANTMLAALDVRGSLNTQPTASISATSSFCRINRRQYQRTSVYCQLKRHAKICYSKSTAMLELTPKPNQYIIY
jgi:hypothetical protein